MKYKLIIDKNAEEEIIAIVHEPSRLTQELEDLVLRSSGGESNNSVYVSKGEYEYIIPAVKQFILSTDLEENRMEVTVIEGMRTDEN